MESTPFRSSRYAKANAAGEAAFFCPLTDQLRVGEIEDGARPSGSENARGGGSKSRHGSAQLASGR